MDRVQPIVDRKTEVASRQSSVARWYAAVPAILAGIAVAVPLLLHSTPALAFALERGFSLVCHQQVDRSFFLFGGSVAVCARCLGIYLGAALGLLTRISRSMAWRLFIAAIAVNAIDWLAELAGLHGNWMLMRFALGLALGATGALLVMSSNAGQKPKFSFRSASL